MTRNIGPAPRPGSGDAGYVPKPYREATSAKSLCREATSMLISYAIISGGERPKPSAARRPLRAGSLHRQQPVLLCQRVRYDASPMPPIWLDEDGQRAETRRCPRPGCGREYPIRRYRYAEERPADLAQGFG